MKKTSRRFFVAGVPAVLVASHAGVALAGPKVIHKGRALPKPKSKATAKKKTIKPTATATKVDPALMRAAKVHKLRPVHTRTAICDTGPSASQLRVTRRVARLGRGQVRKITPRLDVAKFGPMLHEKLGSSVTGYAWQLRRNGTPIHTGIWEWSQTPFNASQGWNLDTRMHIASVSKLMTAMATAHVLELRDKSYDDKINGYLPSYWQKGPKTNDLTFRRLLTHTSGFSTGSSNSDYGFMRSQYAIGVAAKFGTYDYENMNFGLCRILIPVLFGWMKSTDVFGDLNNSVWDLSTVARFREYCQTHVFGPSGVHGIGFAPTGRRALAYRFPHSNVPGWNSGDLATVSGGAGFRMSINEVLKVMGAFRRSGAILSPPKAQQFLDAGLGIDQIITTPAGKLYNKNGAWGDSATNTRLEQCVAFFMPQQMELALFVNSPIKGGLSLRNTVTDSYVACIK